MGNRRPAWYLTVFLLRPVLPMLKFRPDTFPGQADERCRGRESLQFSFQKGNENKMSSAKAVWAWLELTPSADLGWEGSTGLSLPSPQGTEVGNLNNNKNKLEFHLQSKRVGG